MPSSRLFPSAVERTDWFPNSRLDSVALAVVCLPSARKGGNERSQRPTPSATSLSVMKPLSGFRRNDLYPIFGCVVRNSG